MDKLKFRAGFELNPSIGSTGIFWLGDKRRKVFGDPYTKGSGRVLLWSKLVFSFKDLLTMDKIRAWFEVNPIFGSRGISFPFRSGHKKRNKLRLKLCQAQVWFRLRLGLRLRLRLG